jgi:hypothetical protein
MKSLKPFKDKLIAYVVARFQESSTWRGIAIVLTATGASLSEDYKEAIITFGLFFSGMIGALLPDSKKKE